MGEVILYIVGLIIAIIVSQLRKNNYGLFDDSSIFSNDFLAPSNDTIETIARKAALKEAHIFLSPYKDIWRNLKLSNKFCELKLGSDGILIMCAEKVLPNRQMKITSFGKYHSYREAWNMLCMHFQYNTGYNGIIESCERYGFSYVEYISKKAPGNSSNNNKQKQPQKPKIDINNCSEIELTELPGISIVHAKRIIKKREEIGGFETTGDFFTFLKLKEHIIKQLKPFVKAEKMP